MIFYGAYSNFRLMILPDNGGGRDARKHSETFASAFCPARRRIDRGECDPVSDPGAAARLPAPRCPCSFVQSLGSADRRVPALRSASGLGATLPILGPALAGAAEIAALSASVDEELADAGRDGSDRRRSVQFSEQLSKAIARVSETGRAERTRNVMALARTPGPRAATSLQESYLALALALQSSEDEEGSDAARRLLERPDSATAYERLVNVDFDVIRRATEGSWNPEEPPASPKSRPRRSSACLARPQPRRSPAVPASMNQRHRPTAAGGRGPGRRLAGSTTWASPARPIEDDVAQMRGTGLEPALLVNLLVDYDRWIADAPQPSSSHDKQINFWSRLAAEQAARVDIRTFGGFDPLKHAEDRLKGNPSWWQRQQELFRNSKTGNRQCRRSGGSSSIRPWAFARSRTLSRTSSRTTRPCGSSAGDGGGTLPCAASLFTAS